MGVLRTVVSMLALLPLTAAFMPSRSFVAPRSTRVAQRATVDMRTPIIAGNWKMNPSTLDGAATLATDVAAASSSPPGEVVVCVPYPFLSTVADKISGSPVKLAAQSIFFEDKGAFTGAVCAQMVESMGCSYVLAGHSERRVLFKDDDTAINRKVKKILESGKMGAILCIGETLEEYEAGLVNEICAVQLAKDLAGVTEEEMARVVIAYEPVWAIGTGLVCPSDKAQEVHAGIRAWIKKSYGESVAAATRIQYGGSVTPESVDELMSKPDIDGCLVGGASLVADKFDRIINFEA